MDQIQTMELIIFGVIAIFGLSVSISIEFWLEFVKQFKKRPHMFYSWALLYVVLGLWGIATHNIWEMSLSGVATFLYWAMFLKGSLFAIFPKKFVELIPDHPPKKAMMVMGGIYYLVAMVFVINVLL